MNDEVCVRQQGRHRLSISLLFLIIYSRALLSWFSVYKLARAGTEYKWCCCDGVGRPFSLFGLQIPENDRKSDAIQNWLHMLTPVIGLNDDCTWLSEVLMKIWTWTKGTSDDWLVDCVDAHFFKNQPENPGGVNKRNKRYILGIVRIKVPMIST